MILPNVFSNSFTSQFPDDRRSISTPSIFVKACCAHVANQSRPKASEASATSVPHTRINNSIRSALQQLATEFLRRLIIARLHVPRKSRCPEVAEVAIEIREIIGHLNRSLEPSADLLEFECAMKHGFGLRGPESESRIPRTTAIIIEAAAIGSRMTKRRHDERRHRLSRHPFVLGNRVQNSQLDTDAIVGPSFQLENRIEIIRCRDRIQNADRRIAARYQAMGPAPR